MNERKIPSVLTDAADALRVSNVDIHGKYYEHPSFPDKLIRWENYSYEDFRVIPTLKTLIQTLQETYHIPIVEPDFIISDRPISEQARALGLKPSTVDIITVSEKVADAVPVKALLEQDVAPEVVHECDLLSQRMIAHLRNAYEQGGVYCSEFCHYSQYVYTPSASKGQRLVLVDVEPLGLMVEPSSYERIPGFVPVTMLDLLADMTHDIISLEEKSGIVLSAAIEMIDFVESIDHWGMSAIQEAKLRILAALETGDSKYLDAFMSMEGGFLNEDSILFGAVQYDTSEGIDRALENGRFS